MWKIKYRWKYYWRLVWQGTLAILDTPAQILPIPASLYLSFMWGGEQMIGEDFSHLLKAAGALILTLPVWFIINILIAPFRVLREEEKLGYWIDNRFVYHLPVHIKTILSYAKDDGKSYRFAVKEAPSKSFVQFKIENEGGLGSVLITNHEKNEFDWGTGQIRCGVRLNYKREAVVKIKMPQDSAETVSTISMIYWEK